jgi:hypothetical protein
MQDLHEYVVDSLNTVGKDGWEAVAAKSGVSVHTIIKVAKREIESPRWHTLAPLVKHFRKHPARARVKSP